MPPASSSSIQLIVAAYLQAQYPRALEAFLREAGLDEGDLDSDRIPDLRDIVLEHELSQLPSSLQQSASLNSTPHTAPTRPGPSKDELLRRTIPQPAPLNSLQHKIGNVGIGNLLSVGVEVVGRRWFDTGSASYKSAHDLRILTTSTDRTLKIISLPNLTTASTPSSQTTATSDVELNTTEDGVAQVEMILNPHRAAILSFAMYPEAGGRGRGRWVVTGSMDGSAVLTDLITNTAVQTFRHAKFVVRVAFSPDGRWLATASYDRTIAIYEVVPRKDPSLDEEDEDMLDDLDPEDDPLLAAEPDLQFVKRHTIEDLPGNPESIVFHPTSSHLLYTTRSSHLLHYLSLPTFAYSTKSFNPNPADTHVSFAVLNMVIHPEGGLVACQTGDHAGHSGERVLIYDVAPPPARGEVGEGRDKSDDERLQTIWTGSQGDDYVLPRMAWLPDGSGIVTTTTTGQLTLLDLSGKIRSRLKIHGGMVNGAPASEIVRDVSAFMLPVSEGGRESEMDGGQAVAGRSEGGEVRIVSVGFDGQICISR